MAGSYTSPNSTESDLPQMVQARIEGLKLLAHHLDEPIVIFNPQMKMVYANPAADKLAADCPLTPDPSVGVSQSNMASTKFACEPCPASLLFQSSALGQESSSDSAPFSNFPASCPYPRAVPLKSQEGMTYFSVHMGVRGNESAVVAPQEHLSSEISESTTDLTDDGVTQKIIGHSEPIQQLVEMIRLVAASEATVLIQGESGTGKELVAKTIHAASRRQGGPFVVVECSSLPESLLESELFGHVRGAFTGAVADRKGLFEEAEGGTIFLDEIASTSPAFQARLLRVLQEGEIKPVGSSQSIKVNVRVISAGNIPLEQLVQEKMFRSDLYYRLAVLPLVVPSLRDRKEDIPLLIRHFLGLAAQKHGCESKRLSQEAEVALVQHQWPGNVRELENVIERAMVTCQHAVLRANNFFIEHAPTPKKSDLHTIAKVARQEAERSQILQALRDAKGDKTRAARLLKISRSSLYNKLRDCNIS